jgi:AcrR family transcriptional regulator
MPEPGERQDPIARILDAAHDCIARVGVSKTTLDDVARDAGCSRATLYRHLPGKAEVVARLVEREANRLDAALGAAAADATDLASAVSAVIVAGAEFLLDHAALDAVMAIEPSLVHPVLGLGGADEFTRRAAALVAPHLASHTATPREAERLADLIVRVTLSHLQTPDPQRPITDPQVTRNLVETFIVPGFVPDPASGRTPS